MSKHNYSQYSNKKNSNRKTEDRVPEKQLEPKPAVEPVIELVQETVSTVPLPELIEGTVVNCAKLNVRAEPSTNADIVCVLDAMSEIEIDVAKSNNEWLKVCTAIGVEGYCMRKFVSAAL